MLTKSFREKPTSYVTLRVDDFSYKKLFNPSSYAKVMPVLLNSRDILPTSRPHITWETYFLLFFSHLHHFLLFIYELEKPA